ncbi:hypothetical protein EXIGLDRAFT_759721 [Exidia glandulosa HHB12029]|uniref:F-box domain-containing protein n=1 Tax=Exidia glandulosa HHB12029 TaxID=1314781 RepID=A0A165PS63_EXIGL|nr:hypothetical protein EXIGLDRAFT_759721 [Exidia glandulosa HHB12029]
MDEPGPRLLALLAQLADALDEEAQYITTTNHLRSHAEVTAFTIERVRSHLNVALGTYARKQNEHAQTLTARLPAELLCEVFRHLCLRDRIAASHVSHRWRKVSLDAAALLWAEIKSYDQHPGVLSERLARVPPGVPLTLAAYIRRKGAEDLLHALETRMCDFRALHLRSLGDYLPSDIPPWIAALSHEAPHVERFSLVCNELSGALQSGGLRLLGHCAPRLRRVKFYGAADVLHAWPPARNVHSLLFSQRGFTSAQEIRIILDNFVNIQELALEFDDWNVNATATQLALPESLRLLVMSVEYGLDTRDILRTLGHASPATFAVCGTSGSISPRDVLGVVSDVIRAGEPLEAVKQLLAVQDTESALKDNNVVVRASRLPGGKTRWFTDVQLLVCVTALETFVHLTDLTLSETLLTSALAYGSYVIPNLTTLVLALLPPAMQAQWGQRSAFLMVPDREPPLACPALETLVLAGHPQTTLAPGMVSFLLQSYITVQQPVLGLCGVVLLEDDISQVIEMLNHICNVRQYARHDLDLYDARNEAYFQELLSWHPRIQ